MYVKAKIIFGIILGAQMNIIKVKHLFLINLKKIRKSSIFPHSKHSMFIAALRVMQVARPLDSR
jgi:hypothetical protein